MDINKTKLNRVIAHIKDEGVVNATEIAKILRAQAQNVAFLRAYVTEACKEIGDQGALAEFDASLLDGGETPKPEPVGEEAHPAPKPEPVVELPTGAIPSPDPKKANLFAPMGASPDVPTPLGITKQVMLRNEDGTLVQLTVFKESANRIILEVAKEKREVNIFLRGQVVTVDLLNLKPVTVKGVVFTVADLEVIANAADV